jgi:hypothetical protein
MLTWSPPAQARATATYQATGPGIRHRYACTSRCDGTPVVTLTACAPANEFGSRVTFWLGDRIRRLTFAAADRRRCRSVPIALADGISVSATWRYRTPHGWTRPLPAVGAFVVDCPAAPPVAVAVSYDCADATVTVVLGRQRDGALLPLHNDTRHQMVLIVGGASVGRFALPAGETATAHTFRIACGSAALLIARSGVQRADGAFNYGEQLEVTMP